MKNMSVAFSIDYAFLQKSPVIKKKRLRCWYNVLRERELQRCYYSPSIFLAPPPPPQSYNPRRPPPQYIWKSRYLWR